MQLNTIPMQRARCTWSNLLHQHEAKIIFNFFPDGCGYRQSTQKIATNKPAFVRSDYMKHNQHYKPPFINHQPTASHNLRSMDSQNLMIYGLHKMHIRIRVKWNFFSAKNLIKIGSSTAPIHWFSWKSMRFTHKSMRFTKFFNSDPSSQRYQKPCTICTLNSQ